MALLGFVGSHILTALDRKQGQDELEQPRAPAHAELAEANQGLQPEIVERQRAERLQAALFQIAQLATADISQDEFYRTRACGGRRNCSTPRNFFIALLSEDGDDAGIPVLRRRAAAQPTRRARLARGLSEYVLRSGEPLMGSTASIAARWPTRAKSNCSTSARRPCAGWACR